MYRHINKEIANVTKRTGVVLLNKGVAISKKRLLIILLGMLAILIPAIVIAQSSKKEISNKSDQRLVAENLYKQIANKDEKLGEFPRGEYPVPEPPKPQPKTQTTKRVVVPQGQCVEWIQQAGIADVASAYRLIMRESGCRVNARNASSGAYGIPQSLPASKMASYGADYLTNPITQLRWMNNYCIKRYGSWANALAFQLRNNWY
jgi:hypothetical protein